MSKNKGRVIGLDVHPDSFAGAVLEGSDHRLDDMMGLSGAGFGPTPGNMNSVYHTELSSLEETCSQFDGGTEPIKVGVDMHQDFYVVVCQVGGGNPKPPQRFQKEAFLHWA